MDDNQDKIKIFTDLVSWKESHKLVLMVYEVTKAFPKEEVFGLTSQMRRASISITSNIAEGFGRKSYKEKTRFYYIAMGSLTELQNQLLLAHDLRYIPNNHYEEIISHSIRVAKILNGLITKSKTFT